MCVCVCGYYFQYTLNVDRKPVQWHYPDLEGSIHTTKKPDKIMQTTLNNEPDPCSKVFYQIQQEHRIANHWLHIIIQYHVKCTQNGARYIP